VSERRSLTTRMMGAAMLDVDTFEEVEHDSSATGQAAAVVAIVAAAQALGAWGGPLAMGRAAMAALLGWLAWSGVTYLIGTKLFKGQATWGEVMRAVGFAHAPGVLAVLGLVPLLGGMVRFALLFWILAAGIIALRQALDITTGKAVATGVLGWMSLVLLTGFFG